MEYLIVDGGSSDESVEIIQRYAHRLAWWVSEKDQGQAEAINKGFAHARGEFIAWINSDDLYYRPDVITHAVQNLQSHPTVGMVYGDGVMVDASLRLLDWHAYRPYSLQDLLGFEVLLQPAVVMRHSALKTAGYLQPDFHMVLDHALWIRIALQDPILHVSETWAVERSHEGAKTIAQASVFVDEAFCLIPTLEKDPHYQQVFNRNSGRIWGGLHFFANKRYLDSGQYTQSLKHYLTGMVKYPLGAARNWRKLLQSLAGTVGLMNIFLAYRKLRRQRQFSTKQLTVDASGVHWIGSSPKD